LAPVYPELQSPQVEGIAYVPEQPAVLYPGTNEIPSKAILLP
jgi:hypothetical protein